MSTDVIVTYWVTIAASVSMILNVLVKPGIEALPFANPAQKATYNNGAHDALIRAANVLLNVAGVLIMTAIHNQLSLNNWLPIALQAVVLSVGSHSMFQAYQVNRKRLVGDAPVPNATPSVTTRLTVSPQQVADALNTAIQQSQAQPQGQPNAVKSLADDAVTLPLTQPALPAVNRSAYAQQAAQAAQQPAPQAS